MVEVPNKKHDRAMCKKHYNKYCKKTDKFIKWWKKHDYDNKKYWEFVNE